MLLGVNMFFEADVSPQRSKNINRRKKEISLEINDKSVPSVDPKNLNGLIFIQVYGRENDQLPFLKY